jgi:hypothetical protein
MYPPRALELENNACAPQGNSTAVIVLLAVVMHTALGSTIIEEVTRVRGEVLLPACACG